jgi:hypothetical protein
MRLLSSSTVQGIQALKEQVELASTTLVMSPGPTHMQATALSPQKVANANASNVCSPFASYEALSCGSGLVAPLELKMRHGGLSVQERVRRGQWGATTTGAR